MRCAPWGRIEAETGYFDWDKSRAVAVAAALGVCVLSKTAAGSVLSAQFGRVAAKAVETNNVDLDKSGAWAGAHGFVRCRK